jgi:RND family efflux transporter MFP subunit
MRIKITSLTNRLNYLLVTVSAFILVGSVNAAPLELDCIIEPFEIVEVSSPVDGVISKVRVDRNDSVKQGQVLVDLEAKVEKAMVAYGRGRTKMQGQIKAKQASLALAKRRLKRAKELIGNKAISLQEMDEAETTVELAQAELQKAKEEKKLTKLELQRYIASLNLRMIHSPITGVVMERFKNAGESVEREPILKLAQIDPLRVESIAPASMYGQIKAGMNAIVTPEYPNDISYSAKVTIVDSVIDSASGTFGIRLELPNSDNKIPGGLKCSVNFETKAAATIKR